MTISTHCTDRKELVTKLAQHVNADAIYNRAPTYSYTVGAFTVNRDASISSDSDADLEALKPWLEENEYIDAEPEAAPEIQEPETEGTELTVSFPCESFTPGMLKNLTLMLYSKQTLINRATGNATLKISDALVESLKTAETPTPADFEALMQGFIESGDLAGLDFKDGNVIITYGALPNADAHNAYLILTQRALEVAKAATRVFPEHIQSENEKYYMRSWLVRLGMGGPEFKGVRRCLLQHLKGHSAFSSEAEAQKHREKYAAIRKEKREAAKATEVAE